MHGGRTWLRALRRAIPWSTVAWSTIAWLTLAWGSPAGSSLALAQPSCASNERLTNVAVAMLERGALPGAEELRAAARAAGSDAPTVDAIVLRDGDVAARDRFLIRAAERRGAALRCGEARAEGRWMIVVAPAAAELLIDPDDRVLVELAEGWRQPRLYARDAAGRLWTSEVRVGEPLAIPADLERPVSLQLIAEDARGPRPVAERRLGCASGCDELEVTVSSDEPVAIRVDALRAASGRSPLRANRLLEQVARAHAEASCREGRVGHLGEGGDPVERLAREGIRARHVGETVARARDLSAAFGTMAASPSHRAALVDRRFTDVGVGSSSDGSDACLVVLLAAWPRPVPY